MIRESVCTFCNMSIKNNSNLGKERKGYKKEERPGGEYQIKCAKTEEKTGHCSSVFVKNIFPSVIVWPTRWIWSTCLTRTVEGLCTRWIVFQPDDICHWYLGLEKNIWIFEFGDIYSDCYLIFVSGGGRAWDWRGTPWKVEKDQGHPSSGKLL